MFRAWKEMLRFSRGERAVLAALVLLIASGAYAGHLAVEAAGGAAWEVVGRALSAPAIAQTVGGAEPNEEGGAPRTGQDKVDEPSDGEEVARGADEAGAGASGSDGTADDAGDAKADAPTEASSPDGETGCSPGHVDVNRAVSRDLQLLPGIGPVKAERIVAFREAHGPFRNLTDLLQVNGIGPATVANIKPEACAGDTAPTGA